MARDFDASLDRFEWSSQANMTGVDCTIAAWVYLDAIVASDIIFGIHYGSTSGLELSIAQGLGLGAWRHRTGTDVRLFGTALGLSTGQWYQFCYKSPDSNTASLHELWIDGSESGYAGRINGSGSDQTYNDDWVVGGDTNGSYLLDGRICEVGVWGRLLADWELEALGKGYAPSFFRRDLLFYVPMIRQATERNLVTGNAGTKRGNPTIIEHPPGLIYPVSGYAVPNVGAAPVGAPFIPAVFHGMNF